jgi:hypothetical protein
VFLLLVIYVIYFGHFLGAESLIAALNSMLAATILFSALFLFLNCLTIFFYRTWKQWWKWVLVLILSALPFSHWLYLYPWTAAKTYPVFVHYLVEQGQSTADIAKYRAFPDLKMDGYYYEVKFKTDKKYLYGYLIQRSSVFFEVSKNRSYADYKDAKIREVFNEREYSQLKKDSSNESKNYRKWTEKAASQRIQQQKRLESKHHLLGLYQINDIN